MAKNQPVQLKVVSVGRVSQYNKQKIQAIHPNGTQFEVNLGDKSPKVVEGQFGDYMFEIWQYTPPGKAPLWCGKLVQPTQAPQQAPQAPQQAVGSPNSFPSLPYTPNNKDRIIVAQVAAKCITELIAAKILIHNDNTGQTIAAWTDWIMLAGRGIPIPDKRIQEQEQTNPDYVGDNPGPSPGDDIPF